MEARGSVADAQELGCLSGRAAQRADAAWRWFDRSTFKSLVLYSFFWWLLEPLFYLRIQRYRKLRSAQRCPHDSVDVDGTIAFWARVIHELSADRIEQVVRGWFLGVGELRVGNIEDLIAWSIYSSPPSGLSEEQRCVVGRIMNELLSAMAPKRFAGGYDPGLSCMMCSCEPLSPCFKPLAMYLVLGAVRAVANALLRLCGYELHRHGALEYWHYPGNGSRNRSTLTVPPAVLLHGVMGHAAYVPLCLQLRIARPDVSQIVPMMTHCSMLPPPYEPPPPHCTNAPVASLAAVIRAHNNGNDGGAFFFGHSFGTGMLASMAKQHPDIVAAALLVDPICFLLYESDVVYNFLYRRPKPLRHMLEGRYRSLGYWFRLLLHYGISQEPSVQSCFRREFWWGRHWLHPQDLRCPARVVLSGRDAIVNSSKVKAELEAAALAKSDGGARIEIELHEKRHHGWSIIGTAARRKLVHSMIELIDGATEIRVVAPAVAESEEAAGVEDKLR